MTKLLEFLHGAIHKLRRQDFVNFWPPSPFRRQVYYISLCSTIGIWLPPSPSPAYVVYGCSPCTALKKVFIWRPLYGVNLTLFVVVWEGHGRVLYWTFFPCDFDTKYVNFQQNFWYETLRSSHPVIYVKGRLKKKIIYSIQRMSDKE